MQGSVRGVVMVMGGASISGLSAVDVVLQVRGKLFALPGQLLRRIGQCLARVPRKIAGVTTHVRNGNRLTASPCNSFSLGVCAIACCGVATEREGAHLANRKRVVLELFDGGKSFIEALVSRTVSVKDRKQARDAPCGPAD
jgi:hypothetical protein